MFLNIKGILTVLKVVSRSGMGRMAILRMCSQSGYTLVIQENFNILLPGSLGFPDGSSSKESVCNAGDTGDVGLILGSGRSPGEGNGNTLQYSCLENPMDRGAWRAIVHGVAKSQT